MTKNLVLSDWYDIIKGNMSKDFTQWHHLKTNIDSRKNKLFFHSREIWWCSVGLNVGFEEDGKGRLYERPVLILKVFNTDSLLIVALTSKVKEGRYYYILKNHKIQSSANLSQVRLISSKRLQRKIRVISKQEFQEIKDVFAKTILDIKNGPLAGASEAEAIYVNSLAETKNLSNPKKLSLEPYKGTRDFFPKDQFVQNYIFGVWRKVAERYGYLEYNASILEETDLYRAKTGDEIVNEQTYSFTDRGGRDVTIRPEMTPTVARMVAAKRRELNFPLRWFSIPNLFRYERPQRGRLREHWQLNVDMFGVDSIEADVEIISLAYNIMKEFGAKDEDFIIKINNRRALSEMFENLGLEPEKMLSLRRLIDKRDKIPDFNEQAQAILGKPFQASEKPDAGTLAVMEKLKARGINNAVYDAYLVRGFDYYTGTVFEMYDTNPANPRALFGGGRYDDLVGMFGVEKVSGVGFGWGDVTTRDFLETYNLLPEYRSPVQLYICHLENYLDAANQLASYLRKEGLNVAVDLTDKKVTGQIKTADKENIPYIVVVGEEEVKSGKYKVKNLSIGEENEVEQSGIVGIIKK